MERQKITLFQHFFFDFLHFSNIFYRYFLHFSDKDVFPIRSGANSMVFTPYLKFHNLLI